MIWNDDKIRRLMSMGMMHGGRDDDATSSAGGSGGRGELDDSGESLSVDLGGGQSVSIDSVTGDVTSSAGPDIEGGEGGVRSRERGLTVGKAVSDFGQFLANLDPKQLGAGLGALGGTLLGVGPLAGATLGARIGGLAGPKDDGLTQAPPGGIAQQTQAAPGAVSPAAGVPSTGGLAGGGLPSTQLGGDESQPALQLAAAGRQSGIAPVQTKAPVNPFLSQRPQFQGLPTVNLEQFPNALGRV